VRSMAVSGGKLFCGMVTTVLLRDRGSVLAVRVWDLGTLEEAVPIRVQTSRPVGGSIEVRQLLVSGGEVWAIVNRNLVLWRAPAGRCGRAGVDRLTLSILFVAGILYGLVALICWSRSLPVVVIVGIPLFTSGLASTVFLLYLSLRYSPPHILKPDL
jgi:hypothetical protein